MRSLQYLLIQARKENDPIILHEKLCFARALKCNPNNIQTKDIIREQIHETDIVDADAVIIGGSGDFSIAKGGWWLNKVLDFMNLLYTNSKITFASCWGFQAMAKARGGCVVNNIQQAELGTTELWLSQKGKKDNIFKNLPNKFLAQMGHEDIVTTLPENAILLASSKQVKNEAFTFQDKPIYCTQFHPELNKHDLQKRMKTYPQYVKKILGITEKEFIRKYCKETTDTDLLMFNFIKEYLS